MRRSASTDADGFLSDEAGASGPSHAGPPEFADLAEALEHYVLPVHEAHPEWERLDGAVGIKGRPAFRFERNGIRFEVNGDAPFPPLLAAWDWMAANPGEDPLEVDRTGRIATLRLRSDVWPQPKDLRILAN
ncbi:hypothetical protein ACE7GA_16780 [Roseomonas sp. CCTCC AB2023176]|uniref:hypothetical protein n=1 Tax=Roseomonas sp. CCTCC AB2023176 TaxID=3342640 RepID=UPI0035D65492